MIDPEFSDDAPAADARTLRWFAAMWLAFCGGLSLWHLYQSHPWRALIFGALALAAGPTGLVRPQTIEPLFSMLTAATRPIGAIVSRLILGVMFYGLFMPLALLFKLAGRDALFRKQQVAQSTSWIRRPDGTDARRYFRPY